jgi:hypothetical protein
VTDKPICPEAVERSKPRQHFTRIDTVSVRWEPYKPDGQRQMGVPGRWQEQVGSGDYWRWQNCDRPDTIYPADFDWQADRARARLEGIRMGLEAAGELATAADELLAACDRGRMVVKPGCGVGGMSVEANIRGSVINGVDAWPAEALREASARFRALSPEAIANGGKE